MHIPDGFIDATTSAGAGVVAAGGVALSLWRAGKDSLEARAPMTGLVAAFVFSAQMLTFPVAGGTSGHLLGGLLAAVLVGPWLGALALTVVLVVQCLLFADGGVSALGLNIINMALVPAFAGYALFWLARRVVPASRPGVLSATALAAFLSVVLAAAMFILEYAVGGNGAAPIGTVAAAMVGVHVPIGLGEAAITTLAVGAVLSARPDLVYGARDLRRPADADPVPS
ncbi:MAG: energy-coupling factor ABC transporter permease [Acidimicrobiales bacterium]